MASHWTLSLTVLVVTIPLLYFPIKFILSTLRPSRYPPGPSVFPGLGNLHQVPILWSHIKFDDWAKKYGPIVGLKLGPQNAVVLNDASLVHELIVKRGISFNERPGMYVAQKHIFQESPTAYSLYMDNDYSMRLRSMSKHFLVGSGLTNLVPMQKASAARLVYDLYQTPGDWEEHLKPWALSTPVAMMSGVPVDEFINDFGKKWVDDYWTSQELWIELLNPRRPIVGLFPILEWVPAWLAGWRQKVPVAREYLLNAWNGVINQAQKNLERRGGSFTSLTIIPRMLRQTPDIFANGDKGVDEVVFMGGLLDAAVGSSVMSFNTLTLALAAHPEVQRKLQAEIDGVFGNESIPDRIPLEKLPYLHACIFEAQRWRPLGADTLGPFGLPRKTVKEEEILGYRIPLGTSVYINQWSIAHDPDVYEDPWQFNPDRYIKDPFGIRPGISQQGRKPIYTFGAGRRECLGREYYFQNIRIAYAQILWGFDILPDDPLHTEVEAGFTPAVVMMPKPFKVKFVPRRSGDSLLAEKVKADKKFAELLGGKE